LPLSATLCDPSPPPALTFKDAVAAPAAVGENETLIVQLFPTAMEVPQVVVLEKSAWLAPVSARLPMGTAAAPLFLTVITVGALQVVACMQLPNAIDRGDRE